MSDPRFARLRTDPRFRRPKKLQTKVAVDDRFKNIFDKDSKAKRKNHVDKYGRKTSTNVAKEDLRRFYRLKDDADDEEASRRPDYARGEAVLASSSEEEEEESDEESDHEDVVLGHGASKPIRVHADEELEVNLNEEDDTTYADLDMQAAAYSAKLKNGDDDALDIETAKTARLAVVNLDWDHVRAKHLYKIFTSLVSPGASKVTSSVISHGVTERKSHIIRGNVLSVRVYPSEFGKERLKKEESEGPPKDIFKRARFEEIDEEEINERTIYQEDEGDEYDEDALRKYQLERLRYYYAIVTCDTVEAATHIYQELDGTELERSANVFDLSFVPDDMQFDDTPRDEAVGETEADTTLYRGLDFSTSALRHSKVKLTWDEDDPERNKITRRTLSKKELEDGDFAAVIASSESESSDVEEKRKETTRDKLRALLLGGDDGNLPEGWGGGASNRPDSVNGELEITFTPGLSEKANKEGDETTLEKYQRKQKEKRNRRKAEREQKSKSHSIQNATAASPADDFFGDDSGVSDTESKPSATNQKGSNNTAKRTPDVHLAPTEAELALLVTPDDPSSEAKHFDMKAILKAEKMHGKRKGKKKRQADNQDAEIQEDFSINVKDDRFSALHNDHVFAIDPSNPQFKKTKGMTALLEERTKRQKERSEDLPQRTSALNGEQTGDSGRSLQSLVESVKRKSSAVNHEGVGKRHKAKK
ncbi:hypothetical protein BD410DRAFT_760012 [Rickenella mellea]|uniref:Uncharacterized protein n=1 Tax=Rickenella mellea TaxID=50990 RepID=A0A4Y7QLU2_9AGAM|nr:hypothetical protein BD410DRAFT_760012 [Rickenella mellea]